MPSLLFPGMLFAGRYKVGRCIASGGMGAVHEVEHVETGRAGALKVMLPHVLTGEGAREQFRTEARVAARLRCESVVDVLDAGIDGPTDMPYLVMELLHGEDLGARIRRVGPLLAAEAIPYLDQVARALDRVHQGGVIHRDLKPENLFLTARDDGSALVKVLDFGVAKVLAEGMTSAHTVEARGTPIYMSPEQFTHEIKISAATDIYALGMVTYTLLTGVPYWAPEIEHGMNVFLIARLAEAGPKQAASERARARGVELPPAFDAWFSRAIAYEPKARFERASLAIRELAQLFGIELAVPSQRERVSFASPESRPAPAPPVPADAPTETLAREPAEPQNARGGAMPVAESDDTDGKHVAFALARATVPRPRYPSEQDSPGRDAGGEASSENVSENPSDDSHAGAQLPAALIGESTRLGLSPSSGKSVNRRAVSAVVAGAILLVALALRKGEAPATDSGGSGVVFSRPVPAAALPPRSADVSVTPAQAQAPSTAMQGTAAPALAKTSAAVKTAWPAGASPAGKPSAKETASAAAASAPVTPAVTAAVSAAPTASASARKPKYTQD